MPDARRSLVCRVRNWLCALPLEHVVETMRALPVSIVAGAPPFVRGLAIVRGAAVPVVDVPWMLAEEASTPQRFVTIRSGGRHVALAVDAVLGIRPLPSESLDDLPPLLKDVSPHTVASIGTLDAELLVVLRSARLVPEDVWDLVERRSV